MSEDNVMNAITKLGADMNVTRDDAIAIITSDIETNLVNERTQCEKEFREIIKQIEKVNEEIEKACYDLAEHALELNIVRKALKEWTNAHIRIDAVLQDDNTKIKCTASFGRNYDGVNRSVTIDIPYSIKEMDEQRKKLTDERELIAERINTVRRNLTKDDNEILYEETAEELADSLNSDLPYGVTRATVYNKELVSCHEVKPILKQL